MKLTEYNIDIILSVVNYKGNLIIIFLIKCLKALNPLGVAINRSQQDDKFKQCIYIYQ